MQTIGVINYHMGNFQSVCNAIEYLGFALRAVSCADDFETITHLILPGVGSYHTAMSNLAEQSLLEPIYNFVGNQSAPFLGICIGEQVLSSEGTEFVRCKGLNLIPGVTRLLATDHDSTLQLPHMGWNEVYPLSASPLFEGIEAGSSFYFVHSYHVEPENPEHRSSYAEYGVQITASVECENVFGVQFHPEKSQAAGLRLLENFCRL